MKNTVFELIQRHASVRKFTKEPVAKSIIESIISASQRASTSSNLQAYTVIAVNETNKIASLSEICGHQQFIQEAPVFLIWCADLARIDRACQLRGYKQDTSHLESFLVAVIDTALAAQNAALAAESIGLGICYIGAVRNHPEKAIDLLALPRLTFPIIGMTIGWPSKQPKIRPRLGLRAILHWNRYDRTNEDEDLFEYDQAMINSGIYKGRHIPLQDHSDNFEDYGWTEHTARRVSKAARIELRTSIEKQGFGFL